MQPKRPPENLPIRTDQVVLWAGVALLVFCAPSLGQQTSDYQAEATYLYNFAKLAEWPKPVLPDAAPLVIGVVGGDDNFVDVLSRIAAEKNIGSHAVMVRHVNPSADLTGCQLLFFRSSERKHTHEAIRRLGTANVLLVGEDKSFLRQGGTVNLLSENGIIRFEVDPDALERAHIHFSPQVLAQAVIAPRSNNSATQIGRLPNDSSANLSRKVEVRVSPEYPILAERMKLKGTVQVAAEVGRDGAVKKVTLIGGHPLLAEAALQAVMKWKYEPAAQESVEQVKISFGDAGSN